MVFCCVGGLLDVAEAAVCCTCACGVLVMIGVAGAFHQKSAAGLLSVLFFLLQSNGVCPSKLSLCTPVQNAGEKSALLTPNYFHGDVRFTPLLRLCT